MGTILVFPADAGLRRNTPRDAIAPQATGQVVILPVIRIERYDDTTNGDHGPEEGTATGRRRRRRARS